MVSDSRKEELSALMDGEASELELRRVLKDLDEHDELGACWSRYHSVRAVLRKEPQSAWKQVDISQSIFDTIESEPALTPIVTPPQKQKASWINTWLGQSAIAAGVAAAVVMSWQPWQQMGSMQVAKVAATPAKLNAVSLPKLPIDQSAVIEAADSRGGPIAPRIRVIPVAGNDDDAMNPYIVSHAGASVLMQQGGVPAARVINVSAGEGTAQ